MILDLLVVIMFLYIGMIGFRRGAWLSVLHLSSTLFSLWVAFKLYLQISQRLVLFVPFPKTHAYDLNYAIHFDNIQQRFDHIIAFLIIAIVTKLICYGVIVIFDNIIKSNGPKTISRVVGVLMGMVSATLICSTLLYAIALYPHEIVQQQLANGNIAAKLLLHVPYVSTFILQL